MPVAAGIIPISDIFTSSPRCDKMSYGQELVNLQTKVKES